jgi:hypothetical protein
MEWNDMAKSRELEAKRNKEMIRYRMVPLCLGEEMVKIGLHY